MELHDCINFVLNSTQNAVHAYFREQLSSFDVTPIQYSVLKCLWDEDEQTPTQLAKLLQVDTATVTGLLGRLEKKNLIIRKYSRKDRRSVIVCLQPDGRNLQNDIETAIYHANLAITAGMSPEEVTKLKAQCKLMKENAKIK